MSGTDGELLAEDERGFAHYELAYRTGAGGERCPANFPHHEVTRIALLLLLVSVAIVLGIIGVVAKGLFYLLVIGVVVLVADFVLLGLHLGRRRGRLPW
ncbi:hypothetical protein [Streptomyces aurantiogriseus]|uniref:Uncharacterized protein n=1 Tax=Streptomyces aurantiogriseus TaxID=66870 RepID=A0A918BXN8_9ACTN|nr:hypothetical protein [Streptomyces aurantiogriseus]GGQ95446.1 hypothetical protein GCM10010251_07460 [Streptomyces aurantiogriseus]